MKVYIATSGEYSDYRIRHVFARREDAESYAGADDVGEYEVLDGPVEMRSWYALTWRADCPTSFALDNPYETTWLKDFDGDERNVMHRWAGRSRLVLEVTGWDLARVRKVYSEQRARYLARAAGIS